ncbi:phytoene/squalene synthase family protein [Luteimonas sp. S4-F44]|uniref:15-cis-phytoene synthase CrtB n=1 Tax=Luteimonas sp. S4-F44 TaxID=2925842 RepID=UPI001F52B873|nr:15-cis-phytoene synthase CrtB [Luteimonas sp. S4-F44]UNK42851.1 phytoene/squalene synthase family protein [Luteimonas sp. S4-F44]
MSSALLAHAHRTIAAGSKSFATASRLFDAQTRRSAVLLYAWCRHCDDVVDGQHLGAGGAADPGGGAERLHMLYAQTRQAYAGETMTEPAFAALQAVALAHRIPIALPLAHLDGFAMDVDGHRYDTLDDTLRYCYHVAGVVGLMMARIMGAHDDATLDRACDLGLAFQLTNIARDIVDDAQVGRCYLPDTWLAMHRVPRAELADPRHRHALADMAAALVRAAEPYYASARHGLAALPLRSAWAVATAHGVYREIGLRVEREGMRAWDRRVSTSRATKLRLLLRAAGTAVRSRRQVSPARPAQLWQRPLTSDAGR